MISDTSGLLGYQIGPVEELVLALRRFGGALDASETGVGKTYVAMGVARELGHAPVVLCPKSVCTAWENVAKALGGSCYAFGYEKMKTGKTGFGDWELVRVEKKRKFDPATGTYVIKEKSIYRWKWNEEIPFIIFDEAHRCKGESTDNSKMMIAAKRQKIPALALSATAAENPLHLKALGFLLQLHDGRSFQKFCEILGCRKAEMGGQIFAGGKPALEKLHGWIFPERGIRITREALGSAFPESQITAALYDLPKAKELDALYADMGDSLQRLAERAQADKDLEHPLTQLLRARQEVELLKIPLFEELVLDAIEDGMRPVVFLNFNDSIDALTARLHKANVSTVCIRGGQSGAERDEAIRRFQANEVQVCLANGQAGGVGVSLHDLDGRFPRISFISPTFSAIQLVQTLGRIWRQGAKSKALQRIVLAAGTVETQIQKKLEKKLDNLSMINDGDLTPIFRT